jgi:hypothetical protein
MQNSMLYASRYNVQENEKPSPAMLVKVSSDAALLVCRMGMKRMMIMWKAVFTEHCR